MLDLLPRPPVPRRHASVRGVTAARAERAVLDDPSLLTGSVDSPTAQSAFERLARAINELLSELTKEEPSDALELRRRLTEGFARVVRSRETLLRSLPRETRSGDLLESLVEALASTPDSSSRRSTTEPMLDRFATFSEYLQGLAPSNRKGAIAEMSRERARPTVELIEGGRRVERDRLFAAFNSPFTPDVLVCTQIGGEGIDLHLFCRVVIHYDLSFNPAKLEQRTGRCDRIGSRAEREGSELIVGVPLLAGSYDERIYDALLERDQTNEALIGGDLAGSAELLELDEPDTSEEAEVAGLRHRLVELPGRLFDRLRPNFSVFPDSP
jgi:hypothetical protein